MEGHKTPNGGHRAYTVTMKTDSEQKKQTHALKLEIRKDDKLQQKKKN